MKLKTLQHDIELWHCDDAAEIARFRDGVVDLYRRVFAEEPYFEDFSQEEAQAIYDRLTHTPKQITVVALRADAVVGFGIAVPLPSCPVEARELSGILPVKHTMYLAELAVESALRPTLVPALTRARLNLVDRAAFTHVCLRVAAGRTATREMYASLAFQDTGVSMKVPHRRTDGTVRTDDRLFLSRVLSQVKLEE